MQEFGSNLRYCANDMDSRLIIWNCLCLSPLPTIFFPIFFLSSMITCKNSLNISDHVILRTLCVFPCISSDDFTTCLIVLRNLSLNEIVQRSDDGKDLGRASYCIFKHFLQTMTKYTSNYESIRIRSIRPLNSSWKSWRNTSNESYRTGTLRISHDEINGWQMRWMSFIRRMKIDKKSISNLWRFCFSITYFLLNLVLEQNHEFRSSLINSLTIFWKLSLPSTVSEFWRIVDITTNSIWTIILRKLCRKIFSFLKWIQLYQ